MLKLLEVKKKYKWCVSKVSQYIRKERIYLRRFSYTRQYGGRVVKALDLSSKSPTRTNIFFLFHEHTIHK